LIRSAAEVVHNDVDLGIERSQIREGRIAGSIYNSTDPGAEDQAVTDEKSPSLNSQPEIESGSDHETSYTNKSPLTGLKRECVSCSKAQGKRVNLVTNQYCSWRRPLVDHVDIDQTQPFPG
jgi:hypothetical protein